MLRLRTRTWTPALSQLRMRTDMDAGTVAAANADMDAGTVAAADALTYDTLLFDHGRVHEINVEISEEDWADLRANPKNETKYPVSVTVDGETYRNVTFKTKGNTSLSSVAAMDSDRYSFKLNFGRWKPLSSITGTGWTLLSSMCQIQGGSTPAEIPMSLTSSVRLMSSVSLVSPVSSMIPIERTVWKKCRISH